MSDVTLDQKMQLVRQIRDRYHENQYDLHKRERILYGDSFYLNNQTDNDGENIERRDGASCFKIRFLFAIVFFLGVVIMDQNEIKVAGITAEKIYQVISADYEETIENWMETFAAAYSSPQR